MRLTAVGQIGCFESNLEDLRVFLKTNSVYFYIILCRVN